MSRIYFDCSLDESNRVDVIKNRIANWINSEELKSIVASFGGEVPCNKSLIETTDWLLNFCGIWDYRKIQSDALDKKTKEAARWLVDNETISDNQIGVLSKRVEALGLVGVDSPKYSHYDYIVALGGARLSCLLRPKYAKELVTREGLVPNAVVLLTGKRPISDTERDATDTYAKDAQTEYDLMNCGAEAVFDLNEVFSEELHDDININRSWAIRTYTTKSGYPLISIAAPSTEPDKRRANSSDTFRFFFEKYKVSEKSKILMISSQIYVPYQQLEALRELAIPYNIYIETLGFPNEWSGCLQGLLQPSNYLQEIRSTIQAISRFLRKY